MRERFERSAAAATPRTDSDRYFVVVVVVRARKVTSDRSGAARGSRVFSCPPSAPPHRVRRERRARTTLRAYASDVRDGGSARCFDGRARGRVIVSYGVLYAVPRQPVNGDDFKRHFTAKKPNVYRYAEIRFYRSTTFFFLLLTNKT